MLDYKQWNTGPQSNLSITMRMEQVGKIIQRAVKLYQKEAVKQGYAGA